MDKWYATDLGTAEEKLETDFVRGLSSEEARLRLRRFGGNNIYKSVRKPLGIHVTNIISDITVIFFFVMIVVDLIFGEDNASPVLLVTFALSVLISVICSIISQKKCEAAYEYAYPLVSVLRDNCVHLIDIRDVVVGDVIFLKKGDIVPCDCRLISSDGLRAIEFTGRISGKEQKDVTVKDASASYSSASELGISDRKNMISAAAVVISGSCKAVAVATGKRSFIGMIMGELDMIPKKKNELAVEKRIREFMSKCSTWLLISMIPLTVLSILLHKNSRSALDIINASLAVILFSSGKIMYNIFTLNLSAPYAAKHEKDGFCIKTASATGELNYVDSVVIVGSEAFARKKKRISSVYASNEFYNSFSSDAKNNATLKNISGLAFLCEHSKAGSLSLGVGDAENDLEAINDFVRAVGTDTDELLAEYEVAEFVSSEFDTALVKKGDNYSIICLGGTPELVDICTDIRTSNGICRLDAAKRGELLRLYKDLTAKAQQVIFVASGDSPCSSLSRLGAVRNRLTFEGMLIFEDPYNISFADEVRSLRAAEINVYYFDDENAESIIAAFNTGLVKSQKEIAYASAFKRSGKPITAGFGQYKAYLGFNTKQLAALEKHIKGTNGTVAVVASDTSSLPLMNAASVSVAVSDTVQSRGRITSTPYSSEIVKRSADVLILPATKDSGGFGGFCRALRSAITACKATVSAVKYLSFSTVLKAVLLIFSLFAGKEMLTPPQIAAIGVLADIPAVICFSIIRADDGYRIEDIETFFASPFKGLAKYFASACIFGTVIFLMSVVFGAYGIASSKPLSVFSVVAVLLGDLFAFATIGMPQVKDRRSVSILLSWLFAILLFIILTIAVPSVGVLFDITYPGWQICAAAPITAVIGYVIIFVTDRYF